MSTKRLHDRDKSGWWLLAFVTTGGVDYINDVESTGLPQLFQLAKLVLSIWGFVELAVCKGRPDRTALARSARD